MTVRYILFDKNGIIHESDDFDAAYSEYINTADFEGDLILAAVLYRRR